MKKPYIIGITGGSGSGKTYVLNKLLNAFQAHQICLISQDNYYKARNLQQIDQKGVHNFDLPESFDQEHYIKDILALQNGQTVQKEEYTFNNPNKIPQIFTFRPSPIILVEGIFVMYFEQIANLLDLRVFVEAKDHIRLTRRIIRDNIERGYDLNDVLYRYEHHVMPSYEKYIEPHKDTADLVIMNNQNCDQAVEILIRFLETKL